MLKSVADQVRTSHRKEWLKTIKHSDAIRRLVRKEVLMPNFALIDVGVRFLILREVREQL